MNEHLKVFDQFYKETGIEQRHLSETDRIRTNVSIT